MHRPADSKLYVLVRSDLELGLQMAQAVHAATAISVQYPVTVRETLNVVVLSVLDEDDLLAAWSTRPPDVPHSLFHEPDCGDEATAYAEVSNGERFACLPLAGRTPAMT